MKLYLKGPNPEWRKDDPWSAWEYYADDEIESKQNNKQ